MSVFPSPVDANQIISFRPLLNTAVSSFLRGRGFREAGLDDAVTEIITSLSRYREEGKSLFPVVFVAKSLELLLERLNGGDPIAVGRGPVGFQTARRALKHCAPLGEGRNWVVYLVVDESGLSYGVFRPRNSPIEPTTLENLRRSTEPDLPIIGIVQLAENVIELRGSRGEHRYIHLSGVLTDTAPPPQMVRTLLRSISADAPAELRDQVWNFYYRVVIDVMQVWHGSLAAVVKKDADPPNCFGDGVLLDKPIDIPAHIADYLRHPGQATVSRLLADANLIRGMLGADGITLFRSDGCVLGYNVFIRAKETGVPLDPPVGGARRRAYDLLRAQVGHGLTAAFYRSQDGTGQCDSIWRD